MIKEIPYKKFSLAVHSANSKNHRPNLAQLELTSACPYECAYCYTRGYAQKHSCPELDFNRWRTVIDDLKKNDVLWLVLTGGDPLTRKDFCAIYRYAYQQGFIITVFTNAFLLTEQHFSLFKKYPPFYLEVTVNAADRDLYDKMSAVKGSFSIVDAVLGKLKTAGIGIRIKTQVTRLNLREIPSIAEYAGRLNAVWRPDYFLFPALDGSKQALNLRITPQQMPERDLNVCTFDKIKKNGIHALFTCSAPYGNAFFLDPYGNMSLCNLLRNDKMNILKKGIAAGLSALKERYAQRNFQSRSPCKICKSRVKCLWCPGKAFLETQNLEKPIAYCCKLFKQNDTRQK